MELIVSTLMCHTKGRKHLNSPLQNASEWNNTVRPAFLSGIHYITAAVEVVGCRHHLDKYGDLYADWDTANLNEAQQTVASISFIITFLTVYVVMKCRDEMVTANDEYTGSNN